MGFSSPRSFISLRAVLILGLAVIAFSPGHGRNQCELCREHRAGVFEHQRDHLGELRWKHPERHPNRNFRPPSLSLCVSCFGWALRSRFRLPVPLCGRSCISRLEAICVEREFD